MNVVLTIVLAVQMLSALGMIGLILVQHGKGADMGAAFGSGGSGSLFGASGSANFLSRSTSSVLEGAAVTAPAGAASGAAQIPATTAPASTSAAVPAPPAPAASG